MKTAVDTNPLLDLLTGAPEVAAATRRSIVDAERRGPLVICSVVYAEIASTFERQADLNTFLSELNIEREELSTIALRLAGQAWRTYSRRTSRETRCPHCGARLSIACPACGATVSWRQHVLSDFLIGAHALEDAGSLITRDQGYFRTYFPTLRLTIPGA